MIIKFNRKEVLKYFKWRIRRKIKKREKFMSKNKEVKKIWNDFVNDFDKFITYGEI